MVGEDAIHVLCNSRVQSLPGDRQTLATREVTPLKEEKDSKRVYTYVYIYTYTYKHIYIHTKMDIYQCQAL